MLGSGSWWQFTPTPNDTTSSGMPLLSPSTMADESQASPTPSLSVSSWRNVPAMIGGLAVVGQSSTASGTPSTSSSSFCVEHPPAFATLSLTQVSGETFTQVHWEVVAVHTTLGFSWQMPVGSGPQSESVVQCLEFDRLHVPVARSTACAPLQSASQASPSPSWSLSVCSGFGVRTQLSLLSVTLSQSVSLRQKGGVLVTLVPSQATPRVPRPGTWNGL